MQTSEIKPNGRLWKNTYKDENKWKKFKKTQEKNKVELFSGGTVRNPERKAQTHQDFHSGIIFKGQKEEEKGAGGAHDLKQH